MSQGHVQIETTIAGKRLVLETGQVARQAHGAVIATLGDTKVFAAVVAGKPREDIDFFPLTVDYREKTEAAGKIPGGFFKREGRPTTKEILTMRLIDRSIRPLFPEGFKNEIQVFITVISADQENDADVLGVQERVADADRGMALLAGLAPFDVGQACVVAAGQVWGVETVSGTDHMLASLPRAIRTRRASLIKLPKRGQDLRADMPTIGPETVDKAVAAGLAAIVVEAGKTILLEREETRRRADAAGLVLWARDVP